MKHQSVILFGNFPDKNIDDAYNMAIDHIAGKSERYIVEKYVHANTHPNFLHIKKLPEFNEITIDQTRSMLEFLSQKPSLNLKRAVIIENFDLMSRNAANSILKALEEPADGDILILTTQKIHSTLATIRSRCLKIKVKSKEYSSCNYDNPIDYIQAVLLSKNINIEPQLIEKTIDFISKGCRNIVGFVKQLQPVEIEVFPEIILLYLGYKLMKVQTEKEAASFLGVQKLVSLSKNTYPDSQSFISACLILVSEL